MSLNVELTKTRKVRVPCAIFHLHSYGVRSRRLIETRLHIETVHTTVSGFLVTRGLVIWALGLTSLAPHRRNFSFLRTAAGCMRSNQYSDLLTVFFVNPTCGWAPGSSE
jgi:hypothetical protein